MKLFTRDQWEKLWKPLKDAQKTQDLMTYSEFCNKTKAAWYKEYPEVDFSNARYAVYVEDWLNKNAGQLPSEILASLTKDDIRYDWPAFKNLAPLLGYKEVA